ncbi:thioredoxin-disulfide reductase [Patescibacteria group bacterium]|nr:thioredoxin-disulfide reductase [Patescibacteria group bacterium]MBU1886053.1 thioredoxin-disulfide reductase [Patescibacteria group bacterium]
MEHVKVAIIGSGPAGYTAGIYSSRAKLKPILFAGDKPGGQLMNTTLVENWPGTESGVMGPELMTEMRKQAVKFGVEIIDKKVTQVDFSGELKKIWVGDELFEAETVIVATGAAGIMSGVPGEKEFLGKGVATCAVCDAPFYREKVAMVIGGGDAAIEDAMALTKFASKVYLVHRRDKLRASKVMAERVMNAEKVEILWNSELKKVLGDKLVERVEIFNNKTDQTQEIETSGVFLAIGHKPVTAIFKDQLDLDEKGFIKTKLSYPAVTATSIDGVFAAGDVVDHRYKQAITSAGMGCQAALDAERWLEK